MCRSGPIFMTCAEVLHLFLDGALTFATIVLAGFTFWLVLETKSAAKKQLGVNTWLEFVRRFDSEPMDNARYKLATEISQQLPAVGEEVLEFFEELGIAWNEDCIDKKLAHSAFSYDAQHWWALVKRPYVDKLRTENGEEFYCEFENMLMSMRMMFPKDPEVTPEMAARYLKTESGGPGILD